MGNLEENEYRKREQSIMIDEKEEVKEIKEDIIQKLKMMKVTGFETLDEFLRVNKFKTNKLLAKDIKELNKQYKKQQYKVIEKLLEFKFFIGDANELMNQPQIGLYKKNDEEFKFVHEIGDISMNQFLLKNKNSELLDTSSFSANLYKNDSFMLNFEEENPDYDRVEKSRIIPEEKLRFSSKDKKIKQIKLSKYLKKNLSARVI